MMTANLIFYVFLAVVAIVVTAILRRNYLAWRRWKDDYKKQGQSLGLPRTPGP